MFHWRKYAKQGLQRALETKTRVSLVVPAVFEEEHPMMYELICGIPVIARTLMALDQMPQVQEIIVVVRETEIFRMANLCKLFQIDRVRKVVAAKEAGHAAVTVGVYECEPEAEYIGICDPLSPFVTKSMLKGAIQGAEACGAAAPAVAVRDTIKIVRDGVICETPERASLQVMQSPLLVEASLLKAALQKAQESGKQTGDVPSMLEDLGIPLRLTEGAEENMQVRQVADIPAAEAILQWR